MKPVLALAALLALAACAVPAPAPQPSTALDAQTRAISSAELFGPPRPFAPERSNAQIAQDILELGFRLESGRALPRFSRFEGPIALRLTGQIPPLAAQETDRLVARLRSEAGLEVRRVADGPAQIIVEFVPRATMRRLVPEAACFVLPNVTSWAAFRAAPRARTLDWVDVVQRERVLVIAPSDTTVQEMRDCLHEEVAQALGPLNDLYRIGETVWNDDNFQTALTGFDMLVLRVWYHPSLRPGMSRDEVATRLPAILAQLNPRGARSRLPLDPVPTPRIWTDSIEGALSAPSQRQSFALAQNAVNIALREDWQDERLAFSLFLAARFAPSSQGEQALDALLTAGAIYGSRPGGAVPRAHIDLHLSAQALASGQMEIVLRLTESAMPAARRSENGALLSSLMLMRAEALAGLGNMVEAEALRRDALPYAIFGFGSRKAAEARRAEVAALNP
ncbi:MAG: DUF2927 domain-containing protein [Roseinatronobacter sp.]|jgi:hypothetical protein|nr:DUF2927 domain-containing protein [Roseinatronobacter sp.]